MLVPKVHFDSQNSTLCNYWMFLQADFVHVSSQRCQRHDQPFVVFCPDSTTCPNSSVTRGQYLWNHS